MPRPRSQNRDKAMQLWLESSKERRLKDIAAELGVSEELVRKWKNQDKWDKVTLPKEKSNVAKHRGGQPGNKNAVGNRGGAPKKNKNAEKHGAFSKVYLDSLDEEELDLIASMDDGEEFQLILQLQVFAVRERRIMKSIQRYRELEAKNDGMAVKTISNTRKEEDITDGSGEAIGGGVYKKVTTLRATQMEAIMNSIITLESELTRIQKAKTKAIEAIAKLRLEKARIENESTGNSTVDDWIAAVLEEDTDDE